MIEVFADGSIQGGSYGKKGQRHTVPRIFGGWYATREDGSVIHHDSVDFGARPTNSSSLAEYFAVRSALYWLKHHGYTAEYLRVYSDSQVCVFQLTGQYRCNTENLRILNEAVKRLACSFPGVSYTWRPRAEMARADVLSKAYSEYGYVPTWQELFPEDEVGPTESR